MGCVLQNIHYLFPNQNLVYCVACGLIEDESRPREEKKNEFKNGKLAGWTCCDYRELASLDGLVRDMRANLLPRIQQCLEWEME